MSGYLFAISRFARAAAPIVRLILAGIAANGSVIHDRALHRAFSTSLYLSFDVFLLDFVIESESLPFAIGTLLFR
jgi:hypothetical protein